MRFGWLAAVLLLSLAAPARAERGVVVVPAARPAAVAADVARAVGAAAGDDTELDAVARAQAARAAGAVPVEQLAGFAQVARLEVEGWRAYQAVDAEFAASRLAAARAQAEELLALPGGVEAYAEVSLRLGLVLHALGRREEAAEVLRLAHALDRGRVVSAAEFPPDGVAAYDAAVAAKPAEVSVTITASLGWARDDVRGGGGDGRAEVIVDGEIVGYAPLTLALTHGQHVVAARASGRVARGEAILVGAGTRTVELELEAAPGGAALVAGADDEEAGAAVAEVLEYGELDALYVVASVYRGGAPALLGQRCELARPACTAIVEIGHAEGGLEAAARELIVQLDRATLRYGVLLPSDARVASGERGGTRGGDGCRWCRDKRVLIGGGVVLVGLITAAAIAFTGDDPVPVVTVDPGDFTQ